MFWYSCPAYSTPLLPLILLPLSYLALLCIARLNSPTPDHLTLSCSTPLLHCACFWILQMLLLYAISFALHTSYYLMWSWFIPLVSLFVALIISSSRAPCHLLHLFCLSPHVVVWVCVRDSVLPLSPLQWFLWFISPPVRPPLYYFVLLPRYFASSCPPALFLCIPSLMSCLLVKSDFFTTVLD